MLGGRWASILVPCWAFCVAAAACSAAGSTSGRAGPALDSGTVAEAAPSPTGPAAEAGENGDDGGSEVGDATPPPPFDAAAGLTPAVTCEDAVGDVYVTPPSLPPMTMASRGDIVRCALDGVLTTSEITSDFAAKSVAGLVPTTPTTLYRIAYRTYREDGVAGVSTARVYLPHLPRSLPLPVVAVAHPTEGLAPSCTTSQVATSLEDEALPWAALGFAVIATDYAGLGNGGVQGYLGNHDQAHSMLDSARALRALLPAGILDDRVLLVGYSQGGGAVLASQGLERSYGSGGKIDAVVVFAAEWVSRLDSLQLVHTLESPDNLTISTGITVPVVTAMRDYAFGYNVLGPDAATVTFPSGNAAGIASALMSLCEVQFGGYIQGVAVHVGDIFDDGFRSSLLACIEDAGGDAGCSGTGQRFYDWLTSDLVAPDPSGAPVLYVQGLSDTIMPPSQEGACNIGLLQEAGVPVQVCTDPAASHTDVVGRNVPFAISWANSKLYGGSTPTCSSAGMPACQP